MEAVGSEAPLLASDSVTALPTYSTLPLNQHRILLLRYI